MKKKFRESKYYEDWILKAHRDSDTAFLNHRHGGYTDTTCYFSHQTAEKSLKSYLLYKGIKYLPWTHHLLALLSLCQKKDKDFGKLKENCEILNEYFIETKYPANPPINYPKDEAETAIKLASEILEFVEKKLKEEKL